MQNIVLSASSLQSNSVKNAQGDDLGKIEDIMLDTSAGQISYAVLSFGGFLGLGDKLFAIPWSALELDTENKEFRLDVNKEKLENAPGFDKDNWPKSEDRKWLGDVYSYYKAPPYWS